MDYDKFNKMVDIDGLKKDIESANTGHGEYEDVPYGKYEVAIEKLELKESKKGDPMVSVWFRILTGDFADHFLFMNQVITQGFQIHIVNEFLRSLESSKAIEFNDYNQYANLLLDVHEEVSGKHEYAVEYGERKGYGTFKIVEVFDME